MRCRPMCLQLVHYSVSVVFVGSVCCSLAVLGVPSLSSLNNCLSTELSGSSVTGAWGGLGKRGSWLGCGLGRPVGCSSALGLWLQLQPPGFLGTYPPIATWALTRFNVSSDVRQRFVWEKLKKIQNNFNKTIRPLFHSGMCSNPTKWLFLSSFIHVCYSSVFISFAALDHLWASSQTKRGQFHHDIRNVYNFTSKPNQWTVTTNATISAVRIFFSKNEIDSHQEFKSCKIPFNRKEWFLLCSDWEMSAPFHFVVFLCSFLIREACLPLYAVKKSCSLH